MDSGVWLLSEGSEEMGEGGRIIDLKRGVRKGRACRGRGVVRT